MSRRIKFSRFMTMYFLGMSWWNFFFMRWPVMMPGDNTNDISNNFVFIVACNDFYKVKIIFEC